MGPLLQVDGLMVHFPVKMNLVQLAARRLAGLERPRVHAVDGISFEIRRGEILGLVGESGCGKTTTGRAILRLVRPSAGRILFDGQDITDLEEEKLRPLRQKMQIVFQDPHAALNPAMTIGQSIQDPLLIHRDASEAEAREETMRVMEEVGLTPAADLFDKYPADLSGGQKQRAVIARAIILKPSFIVADEPVAMLDMSVRARLLELLLALKERYDLTYLLITHDLATAKFVCDRIAIMYLGRIVEMAPARAVYEDPKHPYTKALIGAIPIPEPGRQRQLTLPRGEVPDAIAPPAGCRFHPRCPVALPTCGWEGRDLVELLEQWGLAAGWQAEGALARWRPRHESPEAAIPQVRQLLSRAPASLVDAVQDVVAEDGTVVVRFRAPAPLAPRDVEGRLVECLLY